MAMVSDPTSASSSPMAASPSVPPLENGDRLTRAEFERRYDAMPHLKKAELIEGIVYMGSPVGHENHGRPHGRLGGWLDRYAEGTPGVDLGDNSSIRLDQDAMPQPDAFFYILPEFGGRLRIGDGDIAEGAPDLVAEVASSSVSLDLHAKRETYRRNGVREYLVWRTRERAFDWFVLRGGEFQPLPPGADGIFRSEVFPGLWLDAGAMIRGDRAAVSAVLRRGLDSPEHAAFVARLRLPEGAGPAAPPAGAR